MIYSLSCKFFSIYKIDGYKKISQIAMNNVSLKMSYCHTLLCHSEAKMIELALIPHPSLRGLTMHVSCKLGWVKSLSSSLLSATFFPAALPLTSISLLAAPLSPDAPWEEEEDSSTALCPAWGVAWTVLHIINLGITWIHTHKTLYSCIQLIDRL